MILSRRVSLHGVQLDELHSAIIIRGIDTGVPNEDIQATALMGGFGQRITRQHWNVLEVRVTFGIDVPRTNPALRRQIWESVIAWALPGGWLTVNYLTGRRMYVDKTVIPSSGNLRDWTADFTIVFRAYSVPFWQDSTATELTYTGSSGSGNSMAMNVPGQFTTVADVDFKNTSGSAITSFQVKRGGKGIVLSGISLADNDTLKIEHDTSGIMRVRCGTTGVNGKIQSGSLDDMYVQPGTGNFSFSASGSGELKISVYGRYA